MEKVLTNKLLNGEEVDSEGNCRERPSLGYKCSPAVNTAKKTPKRLTKGSNGRTVVYFTVKENIKVTTSIPLITKEHSLHNT